MSHHHLSQTRATTRTTAHDQFAIQGHVSPGYEAVREAFAENFARRGEAGGACCAFLRGEKVEQAAIAQQNLLRGSSSFSR